MKETCPKKGKTAKINSHEMRLFRFFFRPRKLIPAKISSLRVNKVVRSLLVLPKSVDDSITPRFELVLKKVKFWRVNVGSQNAHNVVSTFV